ncbi:MAG: DUF3793 family protein, partial [Clostridia bacterium]|nr:DUF3793 family protein [Clostridia bacterium]
MPDIHLKFIFCIFEKYYEMKMKLGTEESWMNVEQLELMAQIECANKETGHVECQLVMQCAPTLSLLKISNLMIASKEEYHLLCECLKNLQLHHQCLVWDDTNVILLVYREDALISYLQENPNRRFLAECGYPMSENSIHQINTHQNNTYHNIFQNNIRYEEKRMLASDLCI